MNMPKEIKGLFIERINARQLWDSAKSEKLIDDNRKRSACQVANHNRMADKLCEPAKLKDSDDDLKYPESKAI